MTDDDMTLDLTQIMKRYAQMNPHISLADIAFLMKHLGWKIKVEHDPIKAACIVESKKLVIFIADAEFPILSGISLLKRFLLLNPAAHVAAICRNENSGYIQLLRNIGVDGYFYLDAKGARLESQRGLTSLLLSSLEAEKEKPGTQAIQAPFHLAQFIPEKIKVILAIGG